MEMFRLIQPDDVKAESTGDNIGVVTLFLQGQRRFQVLPVDLGAWHLRLEPLVEPPVQRRASTQITPFLIDAYLAPASPVNAAPWKGETD